MPDGRVSHYAAALKAALEADRTPRGTRWKHDAWGLCECGRKKRHHAPDGSCPPTGGHTAGMLAAAAPEIAEVLECAQAVIDRWTGTWFSEATDLQNALDALDVKVNP